ncbi:MAG: beta-lactamase family protein [Burkholderiaceae bacterium]|nr:beta-lactamase family protein [Burkholderiaceae bacterium]
MRRCPLPPGPPLKLALDVDAYMAGQRSSALLVVHDGKVRLERYGLDFDASGRWTSFSVAKSITSTLVGAALREGFIRSMDDKVSDYIPDMKGSAYDDVSIRQLLTMTSGVRWNEDYSDPNSDVARFNNHKPEDGVDALVSYLRRLPRDVPAGTRWLYSTGETNLVGILLGAATKKPLSECLSEKIWKPAGMEQQATWILSRTGKGDQRLLHRGGDPRLRALRALRPERRPGRWPEHRARRVARGGHDRAHRHQRARARLRLPVVDWADGSSPRAASSAKASSSTRSASS